MMTKISRILMPVDFSDRCLGMTHYARAIAEKCDAEIILLHVVNPVFIAPEIGMAPAAVMTTPKWLVDEQARLLNEFAAQELANLRVRRLVYEGIPEAQIVGMAQSDDVELVIMPTHGYGVFRRFLIGSVTAKVLDDLSCAVLTGAHMERHAHDKKEEFPSIACALDLSEASTQTLVFAAALAHDFGSKLSVIHVRPLPGSGAPPNLRPPLEEFVAEGLAKNNLNFAPENIVTSVQTGEIAQTVCDFAEHMGAKLLVIGRDHTHHDHAVERSLRSVGRLRSHSYSIIRQSPCPVLSI